MEELALGYKGEPGLQGEPGLTGPQGYEGAKGQKGELGFPVGFFLIICDIILIVILIIREHQEELDPKVIQVPLVPEAFLAHEATRVKKVRYSKKKDHFSFPLPPYLFLSLSLPVI